MHVSSRSYHGGGTISGIHDPTICQSCLHTKLFYTIFRPALEKLKKLNNCSSSSDDYEMCGILTFLEMCFQYGFINDDAKSDILSNENPPDYTPLLDSIVNAKKNFQSSPSYSASIRFLIYKYTKTAVKDNETKQSVLKDDFDSCLQDSTSALPCKDEKNVTEINEAKRRISKRRFVDFLKESTPALLNKRRRTLKTNETKQSAPKRQLRKCLKDPTPALLNKCKRATLKTNKTKQSATKRDLRRCHKNPIPALLNQHKRKSLKTNKTKQSPSKRRFDNQLNDPASTAGKRKGKAPKPKNVANKIPTKGTLKRKRWFLKQMETEENYEDDIFENCPINRLAKFDEVSQSSTDYSNRCGTPTWEFKLSPRPDSPLPNFDDDNISELKMCRKEAEEYQHRRKKRRSQISSIIVQPSTSSGEVKAEDQAQPKPSCSYDTLKSPLKDDYDSEELPDNYPQNSEDENDRSSNS